MTSTEQREAGNERDQEEPRPISGMTRNIWCLACVDEFDAEYGTYLEDPACPRPGIGFATIRCGLIASPGIVCDRCNRPLPDGTLAAGVTFSESREHYRPWEEEFFYVEGYSTRPAGRRQREDEAGTMTTPARVEMISETRYSVVTVCGRCSFDREFSDEWVTHRPCSRVVDVEVKEPGKVCADCRAHLPPGSPAVEHSYFIDDPDWDAEYREKEFMDSGEQGGASTEGDDATSRFLVCPWCHQVAGPENDGDVVRHGLVTRPDTSCTTCHKPLPLGSPATAITFYGDPRHYQPWEHHHLQLVSKPPRRAPLLRPLASCSRLFSRLRLPLAQILHTRPS